MAHSKPDLASFRPGIYLHFKHHLYEADHLTRNSSADKRIEIHYIGLQLERASEGPRHMTREFNEFFDCVHKDGSKCSHTRDNEQALTCPGGQQITQRFRYLGPAFENWMLDTDPWK